MSLLVRQRAMTMPRGLLVSISTAVVWIPLLAAQLSLAAGAAAVLVMTIVVAVLLRTAPSAGLVPLMLAACLLGSRLLPTDSTRYLPFATALLGTIGAFALAVPRVKLRRPPKPFLAATALYVLAAIVATLFSAQRAQSGVYVAGIVATLALAFFVLPALRRGAVVLHLLEGLLLAGTLLALISIWFWLFKPADPHDPTGVYLITELTVAGQPTGVLLPRVAGAFLNPGYQAIALALAVIAAAALGMVRQRGWALHVAFGALTIGLILTMSRTGWLMALIGAVVLLVAATVHGGRRVLAATGAGVIGVALVALMTGYVGVSARYDVTSDVYGLSPETVYAFFRAPSGTGTSVDPDTGGTGNGSSVNTPRVPTPNPSLLPDRTPIRGGADMSGRLTIWRASIEAIAARPITGYGLGTNASAIRPYLAKHGLTGTYSSHNTLLRTGVEIGVIGLVALLLVVALAGWAGIGRAVRSARASEWWILAVLAGAMLGSVFETFLLGGMSLASATASIALGLAATPRAPHAP